MEALEEWGEELRKGHLVVAMRVDGDEQGHHNEQKCWLAHVLGLAFQLPEQTVHSTQTFQKG